MRANILIVDDEPVARKTLTDILRLEGYNVACVANGQAGVEHLRAHHVDVMIVDLKMPGMSGLDVIHFASQVSPDTEIILLTAYGSTESAVEALRLRIHDYLTKPAAPAQILNSVRRGLERREARLRSKSGLSDAMDIEEGVIFKFRDGTVVDLSRRVIHYQDRGVHLTPAEGRLLRILLDNPGRVFTHRELVLLVQGYETSQLEAPEILRPLVSRLRHKLASIPLLAECIVSVRGTGYVLEESNST